MRNIKNKLGKGVFVLLASLAVMSCTEKSDWGIDEAYSRPFGTNEDGLNVSTDDRVARATVTWDAMPNVESYVIEISKNELTDETPMGEEGSLVFGNDESDRIVRGPYQMDNLEANASYYLRIKSLAGGKESKWVYLDGTFKTVSEETVLNVPSDDDIPVAEGRVRMSWEAGLAVTHFSISQVGGETTDRDITAEEAAAGEAWITGLSMFSTYNISIYNNTTIRGTRQVLIPGLEIDSEVTEVLATTAIFSWDDEYNVTHYACVPSTQGRPEFSDATTVALEQADIEAHAITIPNLTPDTEYTVYAFLGGSICAQATFTTKLSKPTGYDKEMTIDAAIADWGNLSGNILITLTDGQVATLPSGDIAAGVTNIMFWAEGASQSTLQISNLEAQGDVTSIGFYNLKLNSNGSNNTLVYQYESNGSISSVNIKSCTLEEYRGLIRIRSTKGVDLKIDIDDCVIDKLGLHSGTNNNYGILQASESNTSLLSSITLNMTNSTFARPQGGNSIVLRTRNNQTNAAIHIENCTFYGLRTNDAFMRDIVAASTSCTMVNTLFAEGGSGLFYSNSNVPSDISGWRSVYTASDFAFRSNTVGTASISSLSLTSSALFPNGSADTNAALDLTYGPDATNEVKAIGDQRWNK